jgi:DNA-binding NarL/FixJ family response regulator
MVRVLLVDDHEIVRKGLELVLEAGLAGASFVVAGSAAEAVEVLERAPFDLVLLDINLPGRSGMEVLEELHRRWPRTPVLIVSAYPEEDFAVRCLRLGAAGYVAKGAAADELVSAAQKVLAGGKYVTAAVAERLAGAIGGVASGAAPHEALSNRELEVLRLVASGKTLREIAEQLRLSEKTIATYRARLAAKLGASTNVELTRYALQHGLVD